MDSLAKESEATMPIHTSTICAGGRCIGHVHIASVLARLVEEIPDVELARGDFDVVILRWHHILYTRIGGVGQKPVHSIISLRGFFGAPNQMHQISISRF